MKVESTQKINEPVHYTRAYKILKHKAYLDRGMGLTNYLKYVIAALGIATDNIKFILIVALAYAIFSYILGIIWFKYGLVDAEKEVLNQADPFVKEMRALSGSNSVYRKT